MEGKQIKNPSPPPSMLVRKYRRGNLIISGLLLGSVASIYVYTMWSTSQGAFSDDELNTTVKKST